MSPQAIEAAVIGAVGIGLIIARRWNNEDTSAGSVIAFFTVLWIALALHL